MKFSWRWLLVLQLLVVAVAMAEEAVEVPPDIGPEEVDIDRIKQKYWARGRDEKLDVVQNRAFPKLRRFELGVYYGGIAADPFLVTRVFGGMFGYHLHENLSVHAGYASASASPSRALTDGRAMGATLNPTELRSMLEAEARYSFLYGKLSVLGTVWYLDGFASGGLGLMSTTAGSALLLTTSLGQQVRPAPWFAINLTGKAYFYNSSLSGGAQLGVSFWLENPVR